MYDIDSATGYILSYYNAGEADRRYRILTREHGLLFASATSVRKEQSKLKYFLQKLNLIEVELISSKSGYRITGGQLFSKTSKEIGLESMAVLDRIGILVGRLCQASDQHLELFGIYDSVVKQLQGVVLEESSNQTNEVVELWGTARVLIEFGYFNPDFSPEIDVNVFSKDTLSIKELEMMQTHKITLERYIKQCITETML